MAPIDAVISTLGRERRPIRTVFMIDPKVAGKILKEHFDTVTPEEFKEWHDEYVLKGRDTLPPPGDTPKAAPTPASRD